MKLERIEERHGSVVATFGEGERHVSKAFNYKTPIGQWERNDATRNVARVIREAERDLAYMEHGEKWPDHVGPFWSETRTPEEKALIDEAVAILCKP